MKYTLLGILLLTSCSQGGPYPNYLYAIQQIVDYCTGACKEAGGKFTYSLITTANLGDSSADNCVCNSPAPVQQ